MSLTQAFKYHDGQLFCEDTPLSYVAKKYGTPCYVYSKKALLGNFRYFSRTFASSDPLICYAMKANSNLSILRLLKAEGSGFDVVSAGELHRLKKIDADPKKIIFSGVGKTPEELSLALEMSLLSINIESYQELKTLVDLANQTQKTAQISLRINPEVNAKTHPYIATGFRQHKFGLDVNSLERITNLLRGSKKVRLIGIGFHIGSQILDVQPFLDAFQKLKEIATSLRDQSFEVTHLDLGGGIGIPYADESEPDLQTYADFLEQHQKNYRIIFEPGRFIIGNTGTLLNKVLYHKTNHDKRFIIVDGAMNDLIRPALYNAYHSILPVYKNVEETKADVVGPVCETGDFFARDRSVANVRSGDYLAIMNVGAYGFVAASNYNSRPRPAEILVDGNNSQLIRKRESLNNLLRGEE